MTGMMGSSLIDEGNRYARVLYYGKPGTSKSTSIASMANMGQIVIVDMEDGYEKDALEERGIKTENIHIFKPRSYEEIEQVYWEIKGMIDGGISLVGVGVDHWSEIQDILVRDAAIRRITKKRHELAKLAPTSEDAKAELESLSEFRTDKPDYGEWTERGKRLLRMYRDLPCHVAFASHETNDENTGKVVPLQTDKFRQKLMAQVRTVIYTRAVEVKAEGRIEFLGVTKPVDRYEGKDRTSKLPTVMVNPTMQRVIEVLEGKLDMSTDPDQLKYVNRKSK